MPRHRPITIRRDLAPIPANNARPSREGGESEEDLPELLRPTGGDDPRARVREFDGLEPAAGLTTMEARVLSIWTVYDHPQSFIARKHLAYPSGSVATQDTLAHADLEALRDQLEDMGLVCIPRDPSDDPCIVESWI